MCVLLTHGCFQFSCEEEFDWIAHETGKFCFPHWPLADGCCPSSHHYIGSQDRLFLSHSGCFWKYGYIVTSTYSKNFSQILITEIIDLSKTFGSVWKGRPFVFVSICCSIVQHCITVVSVTIVQSGLYIANTILNVYTCWLISSSSLWYLAHSTGMKLFSATRMLNFFTLVFIDEPLDPGTVPAHDIYPMQHWITDLSCV